MSSEIMPVPHVPVGIWNGLSDEQELLINAEHENITEIGDDRDTSAPLISDSDKGRVLSPTVLVDRFHIIYILFYLLGMATLLPWNFFITANGYWMYKLRDLNDTSDNNSTQLSALQNGFTSYLCITSLIPSTTILILNAIIGHKFSFKLRIIGGLALVEAFFAITTTLVKVNTDSWQVNFYIVTLTTAVLMNVAGSIFQGALFGLAGKFPSKYMNAVVSGQALGGIFASVANIASIALGASPVQSAFLYFLAADVTVFIALCLYLAVCPMDFFAFYTSESVQRSQPKLHDLLKSDDVLDDNVVILSPKISYRQIVSKIWPYLTSIWLVYFVTLAVFPTIVVLVQSTAHGHGYTWNDVYFTPVACFMLMNVGDYVGRWMAGILPWPKKWGSVALVSSILRLSFIPLFLFCNAQPRTLPILIYSDIGYISIMAIFSLSNGYLSNVCFITAPRLVTSLEQETASSLMAAFTGIGLAFGGALSSGLVRIL